MITTLMQVKIGDIDQSLTFEIIAIVIFALMGLNLVLQVIDRFKSKPPINEKLHSYQTKQECQAFCEKFGTQLNALTVRTDERIAGLSKASSASREKLHEKANETSQKVTAVESDVKHLIRMIATLEQRLNQLLLKDKK